MSTTIYYYKSKIYGVFKPCINEYDAIRYIAYGYTVKTYDELTIDEKLEVNESKK